MIGWYVHDHGSGHRRRLEAVAAHLDEPVTGMGSGEPAAGVEWLELPPDAAMTGGADPETTDPTAGGALHWAPLGEPGMLGRAEAVTTWARVSGCRLLVVDVSVEMLLLGRLLGLPTVAVLQPGDRSDPAHVLGYSTAAALLAPWPRVASGRVTGRFAARTRWTGAFSGFDGRPPVPDRAACPPGRCVVLALGRGGHAVGAEDVRAAAGATSGWHWHVAGELVGGEPVGHPGVVEHGVVADVWPLLSGADVVVGSCGGGLVADVAAAGVPFLALPQPRPFDEQVALGRLLRRARVASVAPRWPTAGAWPRLLEGLAADHDGATLRWRVWNDGEGAGRAAAVVSAVAATRTDHATAPAPGPDAVTPGARRATPRVVHVPADHDYVRHATTAPGAGPARHLPPEPFSWPDALGWLGRHGASVEVLHVHFGVEQVGLDGLDAALDAAEAAGVAVVWTVHDLTNPHLDDQRVHEAQAALLARRCAGLLTLTEGAAEEVERRWGRRPVVVPHPHLAPLPVLAGPRPLTPGPPVVAVPLGMLRPAVDAAVVPALLHPVVRAVLDGADGGAAVLRVTLREEVVTDGFPRPDPALLRLLRQAHDDGRLDLVVGPRSPDAALWDELAGVAALVLPYRWGTHSGWVEACHDVGTPVVAPALGCWGEQHRLSAYDRAADGPDPASLAHALADAVARGPRSEPVLAERLGQREASVAQHARLHALAAAGGSW